MVQSAAQFIVSPSTSPPTLLKGQKALVTGANSGIGEAVAKAFAQAGADIVINYVVGDDRAQKVVEELEQYGVETYAHLADVPNENEVREMFRITFIDRIRRAAARASRASEMDKEEEGESSLSAAPKQKNVLHCHPALCWQRMSQSAEQMASVRNHSSWRYVLPVK